jgi:hypothetical protein
MKAVLKVNGVGITFQHFNRMHFEEIVKKYADYWNYTWLSKLVFPNDLWISFPYAIDSAAHAALCSIKDQGLFRPSTFTEAHLVLDKHVAYYGCFEDADKIFICSKYCYYDVYRHYSDNKYLDKSKVNLAIWTKV